jgi:hypothetical protein
MNLKKPILLFLALILPVGVFVFLKYFGKNEFAVPALFADGISVPVGCESFRYEVPYFIPDTVLTTLRWNKQDSISLVVFKGSLITNQQERSIQLNRIFTAFPFDKFQVTMFSEDPETEQTILTDSRLILVQGQKIVPLRDCVFLLKPADNVVLLDFKKRIRGQYNLTNREDVDRLIMEMNIILKKY